jgi:formylglycine-generating enzyme required for sulfatase activity
MLLATTMAADGSMRALIATLLAGLVSAVIAAAPVAAQPAPASGAVVRDCADCPELVVIPAGSFLMGKSERERRVGQPAANAPRACDGPCPPWTDAPQIRVAIARAFALGRFEVTFAEWDACVASGGCNLYRPDDAGWGRGRRPVINVSWADAQAYLAWLGGRTGRRYRLPSESEWEYAARAGTTTAFFWGDAIGDACRYANLEDQALQAADPAHEDSVGCTDRAAFTAEVGSYAPNRFGLYDMIGNVSEWIADCAGEIGYRRHPRDGSALRRGDCTMRGDRGGAWIDPWHAARTSDRSSRPADLRLQTLGFRIARDLR